MNDCPQISVNGPSQPFAALQKMVALGEEADIEPAALTTRIYQYTP
jgi:hypothetical protein